MTSASNVGRRRATLAARPATRSSSRVASSASLARGRGVTWCGGRLGSIIFVLPKVASWRRRAAERVINVSIRTKRRSPTNALANAQYQRFPACTHICSFRHVCASLRCGHSMLAALTLRASGLRALSAHCATSKMLGVCGRTRKACRVCQGGDESEEGVCMRHLIVYQHNKKRRNSERRLASQMANKYFLWQWH